MKYFCRVCLATFGIVLGSKLFYENLSSHYRNMFHLGGSQSNFNNGLHLFLAGCILTKPKLFEGCQSRQVYCVANFS